jgi:hypothetical protein
LSESERPHRGEAALLTGLLAGQTLSEAARNARIARNTARRILEQPRVRQALADALLVSWERDLLARVTAPEWRGAPLWWDLDRASPAVLRALCWPR